MLGFVVSVLLFYRKPRIRRVAQIYWILLFVFYCLSFPIFPILRIPIELLVVLWVYCIGCTLYFQTRSIKQHFFSGLSHDEIAFTVKESLSAQIDDQQVTGFAKKPTGLVIIQISTLVSSIIVGYFAFCFLAFALIFAGLNHPLLVPSALLPFVLAFSGLFLGVPFKPGKRRIWFAVCIYWALLFVVLLYLGFAYGILGGWLVGGTYYFYVLSLVSCIGCVLYFQKRQIKEYFNVKSVKKQSP